MFDDSGSTPEQRRAEADRILDMMDGNSFPFEDNEKQFINNIRHLKASVSTKQIFWLRDIKDKYLGL